MRGWGTGAIIAAACAAVLALCVATARSGADDRKAAYGDHALADGFSGFAIH